MLILGCLGLLGEEAYLCLTHYLDQVPCGGGGDNNNDDNDNESGEDDDIDNDNDNVDDDVDDQETVTDFHRERMEEHPLPQVLFSNLDWVVNICIGNCNCNWRTTRCHRFCFLILKL